MVYNHEKMFSLIGIQENIKGSHNETYLHPTRPMIVMTASVGGAAEWLSHSAGRSIWGTIWSYTEIGHFYTLQLNSFTSK